jgi:predicted Zn-dependent protease
LLARTATAWGWNAEKVELLWLLAKNDETKLAALQTLYQHYSDAGDTVGLYRTLLRLVEVMPNDLALQNNSAQISLLLGTDLERACRIAGEVRSKEPSNSAFVSTYAFSLYIKGDTNAALNTMNQLSSEQLRDPAIALYYGVILSAAGQTEKADEYLRLGSGANLLPEEKALARKARNTADKP